MFTAPYETHDPHEIHEIADTSAAAAREDRHTLATEQAVLTKDVRGC